MDVEKEDNVSGMNYDYESSNESNPSNNFIRDFMDLDEFLAVTSAVSPTVRKESSDENNHSSGPNTDIGDSSDSTAPAEIPGLHNPIVNNERQMQELSQANEVSKTKQEDLSRTGDGNASDNSHGNTRRPITRQHNSAAVGRKTSRTLVNDSFKDKKYWDRRIKNNIAAKRSRDAKRLKEISVVERWKFLEEENERLKREISNMKERTKELENELQEAQ